MTRHEPQWPIRRSIRLAAYDYASPGAYFVTILAWSRRKLFGQLVRGRMQHGRRDDESTDCSLGEIVGSYKSEVTRKINRLRGTPGQRVWTRNYHERIIRSNTVLTNARRYIQENVQKGMGQGRLSRTVSPWVGATRLYYRT
jgi:hypothetical protein